MSDVVRSLSPTSNPKRSPSIVRRKIENLRRRRRRHLSSKDAVESNGDLGPESRAWDVLGQTEDNSGGSDSWSGSLAHSVTLPALGTSLSDMSSTSDTRRDEGENSHSNLSIRSDSNDIGSKPKEDPTQTPLTFFSSVISAAQNAANTFTNLTGSGPTVHKKEDDMKSPIDIVANEAKQFEGRPRADTEPALRTSIEGLRGTPSKAVTTLGKGELSLSSILNQENFAKFNDEPVVDASFNSDVPFSQDPKLLADEKVGLSGPKKRRGSSVTSQPQTPQVQSFALPKVTGYAVASKKRNREFHALFRSVPEDDYLIEDYGCALSREILLQGRMYISEQHICFNANIFGWVTNLVISFDEVVAIEKKTTVGLFPNAIVIQTLHARNVFASFISRDSTYELICSIWRNEEPPGSHSESSDDRSPSSEDDEEEDDEEDNNAAELSGDETTEDGDQAAESTTQVPEALHAEIGPLQHKPTQCACGSGDHYDKVVADSVVNAPLGKIANLLWGEKTAWIENYLTKVSKILDLAPIPIFAASEENDGKKARLIQYTKPLNVSMGPRQTKCFITEVIEHWDLNDYVCVIVSTSTPDVPNGNLFVVKARYCLTWAENNATRIFITSTVEWSGKSWIKGPIEKGANDGQIQAAKELIGVLQTEVQPKPPKNKRKKHRKTRKVVIQTKDASVAKIDNVPGLSGLFSRFGILSETDGTNITYIFIFLFSAFLLTIAFLGLRRSSTVDRSEKWNILWDLEERRLWEWMQDRTTYSASKEYDSIPPASSSSRRAGFLSRHEIEEAISITQKRLDLLRLKIEDAD
ncbi:hypothetical protein V1511DRAFT_520753 [Dipodascopsis uninucleata]